jgi:hypothetical protein
MNAQALLDSHSGSRRSDPATVLHKPLVAVPVLLDGSPDWEHRLQGAIRDFTHGGIDLVLDTPFDLPSRALVLVLPSADGAGPCLGLEAYAMHRENANSPLEVGGRCGGLADTILRPENLTPRFHPELLTFSLGLPENLLRKWAAIGVLQPYLVDRVQLCPQCHGLPTFRQGCANCGSVQISQEQFLHHFACAHVGLVRVFRGDGPQDSAQNFFRRPARSITDHRGMDDAIEAFFPAMQAGSLSFEGLSQPRINTRGNPIWHRA